MASKKQTNATTAPQTTDSPKAASTSTAAIHIRALLEGAVVAFSDVSKAQVELNNKRVGTYNSVLEAAREAKTPDVLRDVYNTLASDIRTNKAGIAARLHCALGKADKDGKADYVVPSGLRSAMSVVLSAMDYGIKLTDKDGKPRSFTDIRNAKGEAAAKEAEAKMSPVAKAKAALRDMLIKASESIGHLTADEVNDCTRIIRQVLVTMDGSAKREDAKAA